MKRIEEFLTSKYSKKVAYGNQINGLIYENGHEAHEIIACDKYKAEMIKKQLRSDFQEKVVKLFPGKEKSFMPFIEDYIKDNFDDEGHYYLSSQYLTGAVSLMKAVNPYFIAKQINK